MTPEKVTTTIFVVVLTVLSGLGDSQGFVHAARAWANGSIVWEEIVKSGLGYGFGILMYWIVIKYLQELGIVSPEVQTLGWFVVTIIGVALASREFFRWDIADQVVAVGLLGGLGWLLVRTGG